jgi:hypothetical protein
MSPKENSLKNLRPYKKGKSGNPNGRPKGSKSVSTVLKKLLKEEIKYTTIHTGGKEVKLTLADALAYNLYKTALHSDREDIKLKASDMIMDRTEGKPLQSIETKEAPTNNESAMEEIKALAKIEGISLKEFCDREGIDMPEKEK